MPIARRRDQSKYPQLWDGLVGAWYPGAGPSGNTLYDLSGRDNHGTLTNGPTWVDGRGGKALNFDGVDDYVNSPLNKTAIGNRLTISMWIYPTGSQAVKGIFQIANILSDTRPWVLLQRSTATTIKWYSNDGYRITQTVNDDEDYHLALTYDGITWRAYKNGIADGVYAGPIGVYPGGATWLGNGYQGYFSGQLNDVRVYNRDSHVDEIKLLAQRPGIAFEPKRRVFYSIPSSVKAWLFRRQSQIIGGGLG